MLEQAKSLCKSDAKIIVSQDKKTGNPAQHRALNPKQHFVRQYKLDDIVQNKECCDFAVLNDELKKTYLIELKGSDINKAIEQLKSAHQLLKKEISNYQFFFRCIYRSGSHNIRSSKLNNLMKKQGKNVWIFSQRKYEENID